MISTAVPRITAMFNINTIYKESTVKNSMTVAEVATIMKKTPSFVRVGLQRGTLPFGTAQIMPRENKVRLLYIPCPFLRIHRATTSREIQRERRKHKYQ